MDSQSPKPKKTRLCRTYQRGHCPFGDSCKFRHEQGAASNSEAAAQSPAISKTPNRGPGAQRHTLPAEPSSSQAVLVSNSTTEQPISTPKRVKRGELPCFAWRAGACTKGEKCRYAHDPEIRRRREENAQDRARSLQIAQEKRQRLQKAQHRRQEEQQRKEEQRRQEEEQRRQQQERRRRQKEQRQQEQNRARQAQLAEDRAKREAEERARIAQQRRREEQERARDAREAQPQATRKAEQRVRAAEIAEADAAFTVQNSVLGSIVTFGAGLDIRGIITGFESCTVRVRNLPSDARDHEIRALFTQQGIDSGRFVVVKVKRVAGGKQEATIATDAESGQALAIGLDEIEFREEKLAFEVGAYNSSGGMGASGGRDADVLTISWHAPSAKFIVEYEDMAGAQRKARELDKRTFRGRRVKAEMNTPPPGRILPNFRANSVKLSNLRTSVTPDDIADFAGASIYAVRRLNDSFYGFDVAVQVQHLRTELDLLAPGELRSFECSSGMTPLDGIICVRARFTSWDGTQKAHDHLKDQKPHYIGNTSFWLRLPSPMIYTITISVDQHQAQKTQWDALAGSIKDKKACNMNVHILQNPRSGVRIRVLGSVKQAVGALKVRVETLAAGTLVEGWHPLFRGLHNHFFASVFETTGAYVRADWTRQRLKVCGENGPVERARTMIKEELERLAALEYTTTLKKQSVGFFVREGLAALREVVGADNVRFIAGTRMLTISGGEEARLTLTHLIDKSLTGRHAVLSGTVEQQACPICFDNVSHPVRLGCGHVYCTACLRHYLTSAFDSNQFPLLCMGDESRCNTAVPLPTIQQFLTLAAFDRLLEVVFVAHLTKHPQDFVYCTTPDCAQIYRTTSEAAATTLQCPACFSTVCSACKEEGHEGMSCAERRLQDPAEQERLNEEWIRQQGGEAKRCPRCNVILWKDGGCNHMTCRCGAHICWRCMGLFTDGTIYAHMDAEHGGMNDPGPLNNQPVPVDYNYREQEEALRQAEARRRREADAQMLRRVAGPLHEGAAVHHQAPRVGVFARILEEQRLMREEQARGEMARQLRAAEEQRVRARRTMEERERAAQRVAEVQRQREREANQNQSWCTIM